MNLKRKHVKHIKHGVKQTKLKAFVMQKEIIRLNLYPAENPDLCTYSTNQDHYDYNNEAKDEKNGEKSLLHLHTNLNVTKPAQS